jgi:hypothetical protein
MKKTREVRALRVFLRFTGVSGGVEVLFLKLELLSFPSMWGKAWLWFTKSYIDL